MPLTPAASDMPIDTHQHISGDGGYFVLHVLLLSCVKHEGNEPLTADAAKQ